MEFFDLASIVEPYTMLTRDRIECLMQLCETANSENIDGSFVECGVCNGGSAAVLAYYAQHIWIGHPQRVTHLFDSFEGLPRTTDEDLPSANGNTAESEVGKAMGTLQKVREVLKLARGIPGKVQIHKGWFADTFPKIQIPRIAVLVLDSDWYASELLCWQKFYDSVVPGGFVYIDDYFYWPGCAHAMQEFFEDRKVPTINKVEHSAWIRK